MVAVTRAAARCSQSSISICTQTAGSLVKKTAKKKRGEEKTIVKQREVPSTVLSPSQSFTEKPPITISPSLSSLPLSSTMSPTSNISASSSTSTAMPTLSPTVLSCHYQKDNSNDVIDEVNRVIISPRMEFIGIDDEQHERSYDSDENKECHTTKTYPITISQMEWCKTNRGNDRVCIDGYPYDFLSASVKNNQRSFRCTRKNSGCRAIVYISIDSNMYKNSNHVEHNHPSNHGDVKRLLVLNKIKQRVLIEPTSITRIIEDEYAKSNLDNDEQERFLLPAAQGE